MDLATILAATDNFSKANKLGEGGFGPVYRVRNKPKIAVAAVSSPVVYVCFAWCARCI